MSSLAVSIETLELIIQMRQLQRQYFSERQNGSRAAMSTLAQCKRLEALVDAKLRTVQGNIEKYKATMTDFPTQDKLL